MRISPVLPILLGLLLTACSHSGQPSEKETGTEPSVPVNNRMLAPAGPDAQIGGSGNFKIALIPETVTCADPVEVSVSGCNQGPRFSWQVNGAELADAKGPRLAPGPYHRGDDLSVQVSCGSARATAETRIANALPRISKVAFKDPVVIAGKELVLIPETSDADGDPVEVEYRWQVDGQELPWVTGPTLPAEYVKRGARIAVTAITKDAFDQGRPFIGGTLEVPDAAPVIGSTPPATIASADFRYQIEATDPDGDPLTYRIENAPAGMRIDSATGLIVWDIPEGTTGSWTVRVIVQDPAGLQDRQDFSLGLEKQE